jgi:hypothetical protein
MEAGISKLASGSWEAPSQDFPSGRLVAGNGLVSAVHVSAGLVALNLLYPTDANSIACIITERGAPADLYYSVFHTSDVVKMVEFTSGQGGFTDQSFDFFFVKMAQPEQGL